MTFRLSNRGLLFVGVSAAAAILGLVSLNLYFDYARYSDEELSRRCLFSNDSKACITMANRRFGDQ